MKRMLLLMVMIMLLGACGSNDDDTKKIKLDKEIELDNVKIEVEQLRVNDDELTLPFWWSHWASNDKVHFQALAYVVVKQDDEELKATDKNDTLLKQTSKGVKSRVELKYELVDDSPVDITFKTVDDDPEEYGMTVDIK